MDLRRNQQVKTKEINNTQSYTKTEEYELCKYCKVCKACKVFPFAPKQHYYVNLTSEIFQKSYSLISNDAFECIWMQFSANLQSQPFCTPFSNIFAP